ncbi:hypothetical protein [Acinetobacter higginsii]|uniref:hypothetical protein n=1 Tax=Acinetobacter higginsii TaxID=70347 RepID=UPI0030083821
MHAQVGFKNDADYKTLVGKMYSLGNDWMDDKGINHTKIAVDCLVEGGADEKEARSLAAKSLLELRKANVTQPNHIPWSK